ncbi:hypothetical protein KY332_02715 [Candidatus Woesearchaeota archaeon]|nr:hypothetical protein [Candidatus Woesearchaeota archaeon]
MAAQYKLRLATSTSLSRSIQENAATILKSRNEIARISKRLQPNFQKLKKANSELSKLSVQKVKLRQKQPQLGDTYARQSSTVKELSAIIRHDTIDLLKQIDSIISDLKNICLDADTILYRESRALDQFHREVDKLADKKQSAQIANQLNLLKQEIKTTARRLYETAGAPEILKRPLAKEKIEVSKNIFLLGKEIEALDKILDRLKIANINEITKNIEKELRDLQRIELAVSTLIPELKKQLAVIRNDLYLVESSAAARIEEKLSATEKSLERALARIISSAEKLLEEVVIIKKI